MEFPALSTTVAIIDYGSGNLRSAAKAFERAAYDHALPCRIVVTAEAEIIHHADRVVLPGVGAFADCKRGLDAVPGMREAMEQAVRKRGVPFLGICVGMQLMANRGFEHGVADGLGWIPGDVVALSPTDSRLKVPHMGWNDLEFRQRTHPVIRDLPGPMHGYFVHSYHLHCAESVHQLATVDYGGPITAMVGRDNLVGTQFHPEKSQAAGLELIANFLRWRP
ncbi:MAG: imidazole glycerol phosphate synthase subunit HisH [Rhodospirillaceae bacterium]